MDIAKRMNDLDAEEAEVEEKIDHCKDQLVRIRTQLHRAPPNSAEKSKWARQETKWKERLRMLEEQLEEFPARRKEAADEWFEGFSEADQRTILEHLNEKTD